MGSNFKMMQMNSSTKQKQTYRYQKHTYGYRKGNVVGKDKPGASDEYTHTITYKIGNQQGPTV